jgi:D-serine dehydratase
MDGSAAGALAPATRLGRGYKGLPAGSIVDLSADLSWIARRGWNVLAGDTGTPVAVLHQDALTRNLAVMAGFCRRHDVGIAPHAKTTMSPELVARQLAAGAWGMTAAVPHQVAALRAWGVDRILLANEVADPAALRWLAGQVGPGAASELLWYVDSVAGVRLADEALAGAGAGGRQRVLLELGHAAGRSGARTAGAARAVARAVQESHRLELAGVAGYEGTIGTDRGPATRAAVTGFLATIGATYADLHAGGLLAATGPRYVSAGGSLFFDLVATAFAPLRQLGAQVLLRGGSYVAHDHGLYQQASPDTEPDWELAGFAAALEIWGRVVSRPEPELALLDVGRRDVSFDAGLPIPLHLVHRGTGTAVPAAGLAVTALSDQHAFLRLPAAADLAVGDLVGLGVSHPCTTFDKWPLLLLVDDRYGVVGGVRTFF